MNEIETLSHSTFFQGMTSDAVEEALGCLNARRITAEKGEVIVSMGDGKIRSGVVLSGILSVSLSDEKGNVINVSHLRQGQIFGAAQYVAGAPGCVVSVSALEPSVLMLLDLKKVLDKNSRCIHLETIRINLLKDFARKNLYLNARIRILGQKKIRDKIKVYLETLGVGEDGTYHVPYSRTELAEFLYVERSALSRELGRMREEGLLETEGNVFRILSEEFWD